jgi:hypothetical protein
MEQGRSWLRDLVLIVATFAVGWWAHGTRSVHAQSDGVQVQLGTGPAGTLLVSTPDEKVFYVYQGAMTGSASVQCTYKFTVTTPGGLIRREQCPVPVLVP